MSGSFKKTVSAIDRRLGEKLRETRLKRELTIEDVSKSIGVSTAQYQKYERGATRLSAANLFRLSHFLGILLQELYDGVTEDEKNDRKK